MEELGKALKTIFDKVADFFDIFDLSFFVSGIATGAAILAYYYLFNHHQLIQFDNFFKILLLILFFYVIGLMSFVIGRWLRLGGLRRNAAYKEFDSRLRRILNEHSLSSKEPYKTYLASTDRGTWRLYVRLWAEIRDDSKLSNSFSQIKRFWVMAATYDGIATSVLAWAVMIGYLSFLDKSSLIFIPWYYGLSTVILLTGTSFLCFLEANRNLFNQMEEVVAIVAINESRPPR